MCLKKDGRVFFAKTNPAAEKGNHADPSAFPENRLHKTVLRGKIFSPRRRNATFSPFMADLLNELDLTKKIDDKAEYRDKLQHLQLTLLHFQRKILESKRNIVLVFEGPDAAGKGGVIKRVAEKLDPRLIRVYSIVKPTEEEYRRHYLWRFWTKMPAQGEVAIFDRSWYGRVLVERVEGFCSEKEWKMAYEEINAMEKTLVDTGTIMLKFYLQISRDEQLRRFEKRAADPYKHWKISAEDWRNRKKWKENMDAAEDMFTKTWTKHAPWTLVEGEFKWYTRIKVLKTILKKLTQEFGD
jgi:polyphosphate kinase 2 (PPK2 family)